VYASQHAGSEAAPVLRLVLAEAVLVIILLGVQRGISVVQSLLRAQLGHRVNVMILEKALTLDLTHFEDAEFYDKLTRARREASSRPLSLVGRTFSLVQHGISLISFAALLAAFSPWAALILALAGLPSFIAEAKFSATPFACSAGDRPRRACRCISSRRSPARTTPRRSSSTSSARCSWSATARSSATSTARTAS
jgi:ATP-binding cassette subfamily B protein